MHCFLSVLSLALTLVRVIALEGDTHHVQGLAVTEDRAYLSSVDRTARKGFLFEYDLGSGRRLRAAEVQAGELYHPGGIDQDEDSLWIPVAEYRPDSRSVIQRRSKATLQVLESFEVPDHIGAVAVVPEGLLMANWDARTFYLYTREGRRIWTRRNPNPTRYQDLKRRYGAILASGLSGRGASAAAVLEWLDPETLRPLQSAALGRTDRGVPYTNEGMDYRDGLLYLVPEDAPSRLFVFRWEF
jgi:glutamine cyclotransferase